MRKRKEQLEGEARLEEIGEGQDSGSGGEVIDDSAELVEPSPKVVMAPRVPLVPVPPEKAAEFAPKRYRVVKTARLLYRGYITDLKAGKVVDSSNYDIANLQQQGIQLEPLS